MDAEEDYDECWDGHYPGGEGRHPHPLCDDLAGFVSFFSQMHGGVVAVEDPGPEEDGDDPAVRITRLLFFTKIDPVVEVFENSRAGLETACLSCFDGEPDPVHDYQHVEDYDGKAEVPLQDFLVDDVGRHGEEHAD